MLFMSKSVNRDNDDFSRNIKNRVHNVNKSPDICINKNIITPSPTLYGGSQTNTPQNLTRETEYNHRTSSSPITEAPEKPTNKTVISKDRDPSPNLEIAESSYPSSNLHNSVKRESR